ncbi:hypothetical protein FKM82_016371 [Ascaphus truei]
MSLSLPASLSLPSADCPSTFLPLAVTLPTSLPSASLFFSLLLSLSLPFPGSLFLPLSFCLSLSVVGVCDGLSHSPRSINTVRSRVMGCKWKPLLSPTLR